MTPTGEPTHGRTVGSLLAGRARGRGDASFLVCDDEVLTYADAASRSELLAAGLLASDVSHGTRVAILHPNGAEFVVSWLAVARIGAVAVPLSTFSTAAEMRALLDNARVQVLLAAPSFRGRDHVAVVAEATGGDIDGDDPESWSAATPHLRRVVFDTAPVVDAGAAVEVDVRAAAEASVRPADAHVVVHTSGSTSLPKGVVHPHGTLIDHVATLNELRSYRTDDVLFSNSPFFWIGGFAYSLLGTLIAGATLVCSNATDASVTLDLLERTRPTMVNGFAASVDRLAADAGFPERDLTSIRRGNLWPIMPENLRPADPELRHNMLGMTEAGSVCLASSDESDQPESRRGSFGRPVPGLDAMIIDPETGAVCATGEVGELWLRGSAMLDGYLGRERHETFTADRWFRTGDLFRVDADGYHYFTGRHGDMIKTAGANVSPREVEAAIASTTGLASHVLGLDDPSRGQIVAAAVRVPVGADRPDEDDLRTRLRTHLSAYKVPVRWLFLADEDVPMMSSGKLDPRALAELFHAR